jgi:hypothetical protein
MTRDISASVRGRLENAARESGRPLQELMQYFVMERFLFRLSKSKHAERFVLKGALMFRVWGTPQSRATRDIDLLARAENSVQTISAMMKDVCQQSVEPDGVEFPSDSVRGTMIKEDAEYSGVRVTFVAMIQNARLPMQIDVGFGDVILEETVQGGAFQASTRESAIVVAIRQAFPAFVLLASDKRLGRFTLGMQRVEF